MRGHLAIERQAIAETVAEVINELEAKRDPQVHELELKIAECIGAVNVLRTGKRLRVRGTFSEDGLGEGALMLADTASPKAGARRYRCTNGGI
jgi:hypothetical protein